ncbi:MAG TPA: LysR family transcriptional regulator [Thermoanaerobaculia bacterium]|nr:LysR family transcriptional regulator [Thermoanaerobaculia bacterium]
MEWLNYHHLLYFWVTAREGSITRASAVLNLTQPTISGQINALEESLGEKLFEKSGRGLVLTEMGRIAFNYADEIFSLGKELRETFRGRPSGKPPRLVVGIADVIPKLIAFRLIEPAFRMREKVEVVCEEDEPQRLFGRLAMHEVDLVISDAPLPAGASVKAYNHLLGESAIALFAAPPLVKQYKRGFPASLDGAPMLLPARGSEVRRMLDQSFEALDIHPNVVAEFEDSALMKICGQSALGIFPGPAAIAGAIEQQYDVRALGTVTDARERFYVISPERRIKHPAVLAITEVGRRLFEADT